MKQKGLENIKKSAGHEEIKLPDFVLYKERDSVSTKSGERIIAEYSRKYNMTREEAITLLFYQDHLNLAPDDFIGEERALDIGSGPSDFESALKKSGFRSDAFVRFDVLPLEAGAKIDIQGNAVSLPFKDNSFNLVLAHCSVPALLAAKENYDFISSVLKEAVRVAKKGGGD